MGWQSTFLMHSSQNAFVLHSRPFRENQHIVDLFTENDGKVSALVFLGQSKRSIKRSMVQPFFPLEVTLKDNGKIKAITDIESRGMSLPLVKYSLYSAFYVNELIIRLLTEDINCLSLFKQYQSTIEALSQGQEIAPQLRRFELALLAELGLSFDFTPIFESASKEFYYKAEQGFVALSTHNKSSNAFKKVHLKAIAQHIDNGMDLMSKEDENTFKLLMRQIINQLLGNKPLNSRKLFITK
jgi:DNA repair protein RecO (recombination protein O)